MNSIDSNNVDVLITESAKQEIKREVEKAKTHLTNHVNFEGEILDLDKNCEYCQKFLLFLYILYWYNSKEDYYAVSLCELATNYHVEEANIRCHLAES
ncbi:MAG TPA: hypothetical protein VFJ51_02060 [Nitrososphaeraceae archaeon]|nr:hypothetical protein [Nitrososphaeraceae archaeon]